MPIVTLTTDWRQHDYYVGGLTGALMARCPEVRVAEISHQVRSFDVAQCAFLVRHAFPHFPTQTIHLLAVQSEPCPLAPMVVVKAAGHYFVGLNDGRFSLLLDEPPSLAYALPTPAEPHSFAALKLFPKAVAAIIEDRLEQETKPCQLTTEGVGRAVYDHSEIIGRVIYIDSFENAMTNINRSLFLKAAQGRPFEILVRGPFAKLDKILGTYDDAPAGALLALFNSIGLLEIAINKGSVSRLESLEMHSEIRIKFYERKR